MTTDPVREIHWPDFGPLQRACAANALLKAREGSPEVRVVSARSGFVLLLAFRDGEKCIMKVSAEGESDEIQTEHATLSSLPGEYSSRVRAFTFTDDTAALVLSWVEATSLSSRWAEKTSATDRFEDIRGASQALDRLHAQGVVHGDLQPTHIRFRDDQPVFIDFGVAGAPGTYFGGGLIHYLAPEYASALLQGAQPRRSPAGDWYALLASAVVAKTGEAPVSYPKGADRHAKLVAIAEGAIDVNRWQDSAARELAESLKLPASERRNWALR